MNINNPYKQNSVETSRQNVPGKKTSLWRKLAVVVIALAVLAGGFTLWQISQRAKNQVSLIKTANETYADDPRYVSFGADYLFAVPKSYSVDETSQAGVQFLIPAGVESGKLDNFDKLFDAAVLAVQPLKDVEANSNSSLKQYINDILVPDLKKNVSEDLKVTYSYVGKYKAAMITVNKEGRQIRQVYAYSGSHPFTVVAQTKSDAFVQVVNTLIGVSNSNTKDEIALIKQAVQANLSLAQTNKAQELFDGSAPEFKQKSSAKDVTTAINNSASFLKRHINVPGGTFLADKFIGQLFFPGVEKDEKASLGTIGLIKEGSVWKLNSLVLPVAKK